MLTIEDLTEKLKKCSGVRGAQPPETTPLGGAFYTNPPNQNPGYATVQISSKIPIKNNHTFSEKITINSLLTIEILSEKLKNAPASGGLRPPDPPLVGPCIRFIRKQDPTEFLNPLPIFPTPLHL